VGIELADMDGDGKDEVVTSNAGPVLQGTGSALPVLALFRGQTGGGFGSAVPIAPTGASSGLDVSLIDADGDGDRDIVSVQRTIGTQSEAVLVRIDTTGAGGPLSIGEETDLGATAPILSTRGDLDGVGGEDLFLVDQASSFMGGGSAPVAKPYLGETEGGPPAAPGDVNGDGWVDGNDLALMLSAWGTSFAGADFNGDGIIGGDDLAVLLGAWGGSPVAPQVQSVTPSNGSVVGGTSVTIAGSGFVGVTQVRFGSVSAASFTVQSNQSIVAVTPAGTAGSVSVSVTTGAGTGTRSDAFTYVALPPTLSSVSPATGPTTGGTTITLTGTNLTGATGVTVGGVACTSVQVVSGTTVTAVTPAGTAGAKSVAVTTPSGTASLASGFSYVVPPTLSSVSPTSGPTTGGTTITLTGTNLTGATGVTVGGAPCTNVQVVNSTTVTAVTPAGTAGAKSVAVTTPSGAATLSLAFRYGEGPIASSIAPTIAAATGGATLTLTGANLSCVYRVTVGGIPCTSVQVVNATTVTAVMPACPVGTLDVEVFASEGQAVLPAALLSISPPTIASITPNVVGASGGTSIVVNGSGFYGSVSVRLGDTLYWPEVISPTTLTFTTVAQFPGTVGVTVTALGGTTNLPAAFTVVGTPTLSSVSPVSGPTTGGTTITLTGTNLTGATGVSVGGTACTSVQAVNATTVTAVTPANTVGVKTVTVTAVGGTASLAGGFTYINAPTLTSVSPQAGPVGGGTLLTLTGSNLTGTTSVTVGGVAATGITVLSATTVRATTSAGSAGPASIVLTTPGGTASLPGAFTYAASPTLSSVSPNGGPQAGGTAITLTGTNLTGATSVTIGGAPCTNVQVVSPTTVTATTPAASSGSKTVVITTAGGSASLSNGFTYDGAATLTAVSPNSGPTTGGTTVTLTGTNLVGTTAVTFGGVAATNIQTVSSTTVTAVSPANTTGAKTVSIQTANGAASLGNAFTYVQPTPTITAVSPASGPTTGGTLVTLTGTNLTGATTVSFGGVAATNITVVSPTTVTAITPPGSPGTTSVFVSTPLGSYSLSNAFTYALPPLTSVTPNSGSTSGGTLIVVTGSNLSSATGVTVGGVAATGFFKLSPTTVRALTPAGTLGSKTVAVSTDQGTFSLVNGFTYVAPAASLVAVSPTGGPTSGMTQITLTGSNLSGASGVTVGGVAATNVQVIDSATVRAVTPAGTPGSKSVTVTTPQGSATLSGAFTYTAAPVLASVVPASGLASGTTSITLTGSNLQGVTGVTVGGVAASNVQVLDSSTVTAVVPAGAVGAASIVVSAPSGTATLADAFQRVNVTVPSWASLLEPAPNAAVVVDATIRAAISSTGLAWRVRHAATQMEMVLIPPGTFDMGCSASMLYDCSFAAENPVHAVTITNAFYIGRYEVTQAQWTAVAGTNPSFHQGSSWPNAASRPVEQVSWNDIQSFASQTGLRLPTEAEWEYACRSGASTAFHGVAGAPGGTNDDSRVTDIGWCNVNATSTLPVGLKSANGFGLHDMSGNVTEFVSDWYGGSYYASSPASDPQGPTTGSNKVARGGAFSSNSGQVRTSYRFPSYHTGLKRWDLGCRMARTP
jgi:formylglycine-generating enzyme required for sulfatase activity